MEINGFAIREINIYSGPICKKRHVIESFAGFDSRFDRIHLYEGLPDDVLLED